jgi:ankyrin repeat protein
LNSDGLRPIHVVVERYEKDDDREAEEIVSLLKEYGQIDNLDAKGCTALERAIINNNLPSVRVLAIYGADLKKANAQGLTPLELSFEQIKTKHDSIKIAEILLEHKADANVTDIHGQPLFSRALVAGMTDFMQLLVKYGVDVNNPDAKGELPIHQAFLFIGKEYATVLKILVQGGVRLEAKDSSGNTALHVAVAKGLEDAVKLLLDAGVDPEARNQANKKPLQLAKEAKKYEVVELLRAKALERRIAPYLQAQLQLQLQPLQKQIAEQKLRIEQLEQALAKTTYAAYITSTSSTTTPAPRVALAPASFWISQSSQTSSKQVFSSSSMSATSSYTY